MRLQSLSGPFVQLTVSGYQFASGSYASHGDASWLNIHGKVWDGDRSWEFEDPCMTTWEARDLAGWLRGNAEVSPHPMANTDPRQLRLWLTEPNLTFELAGVALDVVTIVVYFDAESRPSTGSNDDGQSLGHAVRLDLGTGDISAAVKDWERELIPFPRR